MSVKFLGTTNLGPKNAVAMSWTITPNTDDTDAQVEKSFPPFNAQVSEAEWLRYVLNPVNNQGSFTLGNAVALQYAIQMYSSIYDSTIPSVFFSGRVVLYIPSTGQIFCFAPGPGFGDVLATTLDDLQPIEAKNGVVPVVIPVGATIEVWFEQDYTFNGGAAFEGPSAQVNLSLFNVPLSPVAFNG